MQLTKIKGISEKREKDLNKLNIFCVEDLVRHFPRSYLDLTERKSILSAYHNDMILVACRVYGVQANHFSAKKYVRANLEQNGIPFAAVWFNQPYVANQLHDGDYLFYGRVQNKFGAVTLVNPTFERLDSNKNLKGVVPVYNLRGTLSQSVVRSAIRSGLSMVELKSCIPYELQKKYNLMSLSDAYMSVHAPKDMESVERASDRIALEEYFLLLFAFSIIRGSREDARLNKYTVTKAEVGEFSRRLGFELTDGQKSAIREIYDNLHSPKKMNRLLQGDVGSGKTAVALCGIFMAVKSGHQAAFLSPTEVLARQNYEICKKYFPDYNVGFICGSSTQKEKKEVKEGYSCGQIDILCGTHAIIQEDVVAKDLSFCVCDEQHRFGVAQRAELLSQGEGADMLVMSATPIPRTLSLVFYGDLDVTTITDKPKERQEVSTSIIPQSKYDDMLGYIASECKKGKQAYFVCPKIEGDEEGATMSVTALSEELQLRMPETRFAVLHGKMKDSDKEQIMCDFKDKKYDCLVSTTVIEVGIDVPNATIMVIYNAERFGLSQLHQLRGRVGRGREKSYCFLLVGTAAEESIERLKVFKSCSDGFKIAEMDLKMRGGGDFMGKRQSGRMLSALKGLRYSSEVIFSAKALCEETFSISFDRTQLEIAALKKYESLKDVVLN